MARPIRLSTVVRRDAADRELRQAIIERLDDRSVLTTAALARGERFAIDGHPDRFAALVVEELPTEFRGLGDATRVADLMIGLTGWGCVEVEPESAAVVADRLREAAGMLTRFYGSLHYELATAPIGVDASVVRLLGARDLPALRAADPGLGAGSLEPLLDEELVAGAIVDGRLVSRASCSARNAHYGDIGVATVDAFRGHGFATAAATVLARRLRTVGLIPVWSTGEDNRASQRVAEKLGFALAARCTYVVRT